MARAAAWSTARRRASSFAGGLGRLAAVAALLLVAMLSGTRAQQVERSDLVVGFLKEADMAPFALALDLGYFEEVGLRVRLLEANSWREAAERLEAGAVDASLLLATQPVASSAGLLGAQDFVMPMVVAGNGVGVSVSTAIWRRMRRFIELDDSGRAVHPVSSGALLEVFQELKRAGKPMQLGVDHPLSANNYLMRYWMAAGGGHPGFYSDAFPVGDLRADIALLEFPPVHMPTALKANLLDGFAVGQPWNQQALVIETGVPVVTHDQIAPFNPHVGLGVTRAFAEENPETVVALIKALLRACYALDRREPAVIDRATELLRRPEYLGVSRMALQGMVDGSMEFEPGDLRPAPRFGMFFNEFATYPYVSDAIWFLTQMRRWGQIAEPHPDAWYFETAKRALRPDLYRRAVTDLISDGLLPAEALPEDTTTRDLSLSGGADAFLDGAPFDPTTPNAYINSFEIGLKSNESIEADQVFGEAIIPAVEAVRRRRAARDP